MTKRKFPTTESPVSAEDSSISYHIAADLSHYTGQTLVIGETVFLSDEGVDLLASTSGNFDAVNAYSFIDADRNVIGGIYARDDSGQNIIGIQAVDEAGEGDDTFLNLSSIAGASASAYLNIGVQIEGQSGSTAITLTKVADTRSDINLYTDFTVGRVRIAPKLQLLGSDYDMCDVYIKGGYFIIKYNDGGTTRYKYLDLSGTGTTWQYSTTEP